MKVIQIGINSYEVVKDGKCLLAGSLGECSTYFEEQTPEIVEEVKPKKRGRPAKKKAFIEGGDA